MVGTYLPRLGCLWKYRTGISWEMNGRSADERVQSTRIRNKTLHCQDRRGIAEMWGREGSERRSGMKSEGSETRWIRYTGLGRLAGRMIRMVDWMESWIRKKRQEIIWKQLEVTNQNEWSLEKCIKELRRDAGNLQRKGEKLRRNNKERCDEGWENVS